MESIGSIPWVESILRAEHSEKKVGKLINAQFEPAAPKGNNYCSVVIRVTMIIAVGAGSKKTVSLVVKKFKPTKDSQSVMKKNSLFYSEVKMFTTVLAQLKALMDEFHDRRETLWPKFHGCVPYSVVVFEDLQASGFELMERRNWLSLEHAILALEGYGRYHAMTKILMGRGMIGFEYENKAWFGVNNVFKEKLINGALHMISKSMLERAGSWDHGWEDIAARIANQSDVILDILESLYLKYDEKFKVMNHGDTWSSNMMFKHMEYTSRPVEVKFLDFQLPHINSGMWDVIYFIYTSVRPSVRRAHLDDLLTAYHRSFSKNLEFFNWQDDVPTLEEIQDEAERLTPAAFAFVATVLPMATGSSDETFNVGKLMESSPEQGFSPVIFTEPKFVQEVGEDFNRFAKLGVI